MFNAAQHGLRLQRHPRAARPMLARASDDLTRDGGMQVEMLVGIDVIEPEAGGGEGGELSVDLGGELAAHLGQKEHGGARARHVRAEVAGGIHQIGNGGRRQHRPSFHQHQMQTDTQ